ncbi:MAG: exopolysaccharide Pel transporter PelG [Dehalogenimonas sp.]
MRGEGVPITTVLPPKANNPSMTRAVLFITPALVVTIVSVVLFSLLDGLPAADFNIFSVTILAAVIISLLSAAVIQILIYRIIEENKTYPIEAARRSVGLGMKYSFVSSLVVSALIFPYLTRVVGLSDQDFLFFAALHFLYSGAWVVISVYWATKHYLYPTIIFIVGYMVVFFATYGMYQVSPGNIIIGYTGGIAVLLILSLLSVSSAFPKSKTGKIISNDLSRLPKMDSPTRWAIMFNTTYILAIFLDKIVIWIFQAQATGGGLLISGTYTLASFLGLIPMLSIGTIAYFNDRTSLLVEKRYQGTQSQIKARINEYRRAYWRSFMVTLLISLILALVLIFVVVYYFPDFGSTAVITSVAIGSFFLSGIVFNSVVLPIFGQSKYSTLAVFMVVIGVLAAVPVISSEIWFAALGFMTGCIMGFLISFIKTASCLGKFEFNMFRFISQNTLRELNQKRSYLS